MSIVSNHHWRVLELWSARAFLVGGVMFMGSAALTVVAIVAGADRLSLMVGEAFIAAGWFGGLVGLLGLYSVLGEESRWLAGAGVVFAVIGAVTFVVLAVASLVAYFEGGGVGDLPIPFIFILPGVFIGSLLAFVSFSVASLRSDAHSRAVGILLLLPSAIFVTNFLILPLILGTGPNPPEVGFVITGGLALAMLAIGYVLRTEGVSTDHAGSAAEPSTK